MEDLQAIRQSLITKIWGPGGVPIEQRAEGLSEVSVSGYANLARVTEINIKVGPVYVRPYLFHAASPEDCLGIFVLGHWMSVPHDGQAVVQNFLDIGCDVIAQSMLFFAPNDPHPEGAHKHRYAAEFDPGLGPFLTPTVVAINEALAQRDYNQVVMTGISGGGWTTTVLAALDNRITHSFPVAGSAPMAFREIDPYFYQRDYEQDHPDIIDAMGYLDLHVMTAMGKARKAIHIFNKFDTCCFMGSHVATYADQVLAEAKSWDIDGLTYYIDDSLWLHGISPQAIAHINKTMGWPEPIERRGLVKRMEHWAKDIVRQAAMLWTVSEVRINAGS